MSIRFVSYKTKDTFNAIDLESEWVGSIEDLTHDIEDIAHECAEQHWNDHDGWEDKWPVTFSIFSGDTHLGFVDVEMEMDPSFSSTKQD